MAGHRDQEIQTEEAFLRGLGVDIKEFYTGILYQGKATPKDVRELIEPEDVAVGKIWSKVVVLRGTNLKKIAKTSRDTAVFEKVEASLKAYLRKYGEHTAGKLASCFPESQLQALAQDGCSAETRKRSPLSKLFGNSFESWKTTNMEFIRKIGGDPSRFEGIAEIIWNDPFYEDTLHAIPNQNRVKELLGRLRQLAQF